MTNGPPGGEVLARLGAGDVDMDVVEAVAAWPLVDAWRLRVLRAALITHLQDVEADDNFGSLLRVEAARQLEHDGAAAAPALVNALLDPEGDDEVARQAAVSLGAIGGSSVVHALVEAMWVGDPGQRWQAAYIALARLGDAAADHEAERFAAEGPALETLPRPAEIRLRKLWLAQPFGDHPDEATAHRPLRVCIGPGTQPPDPTWIVEHDVDAGQALLARRVVGRLILGEGSERVVARLDQTGTWPGESIVVRDVRHCAQANACTQIERSGLFDRVPGRPGHFERPTELSTLFELFARTNIEVTGSHPVRTSVTYPTRISLPWPSAAIITADNPVGIDVEDRENAAALGRLLGELDRRGLTHSPAFGSAPCGGHSEAGVAVGNLDVAQARELGRMFGQLAVFMVRSDGVTIHDCSPIRRLDGRAVLDFGKLSYDCAAARTGAKAFRDLARLNGDADQAERYLRSVVHCDAEWLVRLARRNADQQLETLP